MELKRIDFDFKVEDVDESQGLIRGYASTFGNVDLVGDVIDKGAFAKTIREKRGKFPILADHDFREQIGWNLRAEEDERGLLVEGELHIKTIEKAREKFSLATQALDIGAMSGLSIGFQTIKAEPDKENPTIRRIKEVKLLEYSFVTFPANEQAFVIDAKSLDDIRSKESALCRILEVCRKYDIKFNELMEALEKNEPLKGGYHVEDPKHALQSADRILKLMKQ